MKQTPATHRLRRLALLLLAAVVWTLFALYPSPAVLGRNIARYRRLPLDPKLERKMGWELPPHPGNIELFVDSLFVQTPDWRAYRVPWYVPTAREAASSSHGDCESKTMVFASILEGKKLPYEIRASFNHIWVDYPGRPARAGERQGLAYLEGKSGRFRLHWPRHIAWRDLLAVERDLLWTAMPLARKAIWLLGLLWVISAGLVLGGPSPSGMLTSQWRARLLPCASRACWLTVLTFLIIALAPNLRPTADHARWSLADLYEALALCLLLGAFLAWLSVVRPRRALTFDRDRLIMSSAFGVWRRTSAFAAADMNHFELVASSGGLRPWKVSAALRSGERKTLLRYSREVAARAALRRLGIEFSRPIGVHSEGRDYWTAADEIGLSLREKAAVRPKSDPPEAPPGLHVAIEQSEGRWALGYPKREAVAVRALLSIVGIVIAAAAIGTEFVAYFPYNLASWLVWSFAAVLLGLTAYGAIALREEMLAWLAGSHVEIGDGELSFHRADRKVESVPLEAIESLEIARQGEVHTIAVVAPERVLHLRLYCPPKHLEWVREAIERAIVGRTGAPQSA